MSASVLAPQQHGQPSRKGKKAWRKNVDLDDIQSGLENAREEMIHGGIIAELPSDSLFVKDTSGSAAIQKAYNKQNKPLKSDEILAQRSAVPAVNSRKRKSNIGDGLLPSKRRREGGVSHKALERLRRLAYGGDAVHKDVVEADGVAAEDLWNEDGVSESQATTGNADDKFSFLEKKQPVRAPPTLGHPSISLLASGKTLPAVPKPVEGRSYNPSFEAWDALVQQHGEMEVTKERQRLEAARAEAELADRVAKSAEEARRMEEDAEHSEWETEWEGFASEKDDTGEQSAEWLRSKRPGRKTKAERNRIQRRKDEERRRKAKQTAKEKEAQVYKVKQLTRSAKSNSKSKSNVLAARPDGSGDDDDEIDDQSLALRRRKLGKLAVQEPSLELVLPDELEDSLRALKPEGNLLRDRFRSMQLRGKIETRKPVSQPKKAKKKATEKWSYKDWRLKV